MALRGRPKRWTDPEEMAEAVEEYFEGCKGKPLIVDGEAVLDRHGDPVMVGKHPPTVTGLALALGFRTRKSVLDYRRKGAAWQEIMEVAKARLEEYAQERLFDRDGVRGAEYTLNNFFDVGKEEREAARTNIVILPAVDGGEQ